MRVSDRDLELLSTYLDGQLNPSDRARLETRLQKDLNLQEAFEQLHRTRLVLRSLPRMRAPRNYALTTRMAPARTIAPRTYPVFRLVTALASFLLIFALLGDFLVFRTVDEIGRTAEQALEEPAAAMEAPLMVTQEAAEMQAFEAPAAAEAERQPTGELLEMAPVAPAEGAEELAAPAEGAAEPAAPAAGAAEPAAPTEAMADQEQAKQLPAPVGEMRASATGDEPVRAWLYSQWTYLRVLEVSLAVIAIIAGVLAIYERRRLRFLFPPK